MATEEILAIFPELERETALDILQRNDGDVERSINYILEEQNAQNTTVGETDAQLAQRLQDEDYARQLHLEEEQQRAPTDASPTSGDAADPTLSEELNEIKRNVVEGAKVVGSKINAFYNMAKTEISKQVEAHSSTASARPKSSDHQLLDEDEEPMVYKAPTSTFENSTRPIHPPNSQ